MNKRKTPTIRFKGYQNDWEQRKFSDITYPSGEKNRDNLPYESYSITNESGFVPQDEKFENGGTMRDADKRMYYIVSPQSFAYNPARINVGSIGYQNTSKNVIVSSLYEIFKTTEEVDDRFLWHWFKSDDFQKLIVQLQEGGVRLYFYYDKLCMGSVALPSLAEQQRIGAYLDKLDNLITLHQRKLEKLKVVKKSMLENCFPQKGENIPRFRFTGFTGDWEQRKVQDLIDESIIDAPIDGNHGEKHPKSEDYVDRGIPFLMAADIKNGSVDIHHCKFISEQQAKMLDKGFAKNGDVLITHKATIGETAILEGLITPYVILTPQVTYYRVKDENHLNKRYLYACFQSSMFQRELKEAAAQSTRAYIGIQQQHKLLIWMPASIVEQKAIGDFFRDLDNLITLHQRNLYKLQIIKKSMLKSMFV